MFKKDDKSLIANFSKYYYSPQWTSSVNAAWYKHICLTSFTSIMSELQHAFNELVISCVTQILPVLHELGAFLNKWHLILFLIAN